MRRTYAGVLTNQGTYLASLLSQYIIFASLILPANKQTIINHLVVICQHKNSLISVQNKQTKNFHCLERLNIKICFILKVSALCIYSAPQL